jgi:hypothetical protein
LTVWEVDLGADDDFFFVEDVVERRLDEEPELVPWDDFQVE